MYTVVFLDKSGKMLWAQRFESEEEAVFFITKKKCMAVIVGPNDYVNTLYAQS